MNIVAFKRDLCQRIMALDLENSNLLSHAQRELKILEQQVDKRDSPGALSMQEQMSTNLLELLAVFASHGHSGFSAKYATWAITKLFDFEPLAPLLGSADEWHEIDAYSEEGPCYQNKRHSSVFKDRDRAYQSGAIAFEEPNGQRYTNAAGRQTIVFPYAPMTLYVPVDAEGNCLDGWDKKGDHPNWNPHGTWKPKDEETN